MRCSEFMLIKSIVKIEKCNFEIRWNKKRYTYNNLILNEIY